MIKFNHLLKPWYCDFFSKKIIAISLVILIAHTTNSSSISIGTTIGTKFNTSNTISTPLKENQTQAISVQKANLDSCRIKITNFTGQSISVAYTGLPANQPLTYNNFIAIWEASVIPWTVDPLKIIKIGINAQNGTYTFKDLTISYNSYIVGYGVGLGIGNICACAVLSAGGTKSPLSYVNIGIENIGSNSLSVYYQTLSGYLPKKNGNWMGLWEGYASPYNLPPEALNKTKIDKYSNQGVVALNNLSLGKDTEYTLIYFMGADNTTAAAILRFNTSDT